MSDNTSDNTSDSMPDDTSDSMLDRDFDDPLRFAVERLAEDEAREAAEPVERRPSWTEYVTATDELKELLRALNAHDVPLPAEVTFSADATCDRGCVRHVFLWFFADNTEATTANGVADYAQPYITDGTFRLECDKISLWRGTIVREIRWRDAEAASICCMIPAPEPNDGTPGEVAIMDLIFQATKIGL